MAYDPAQLQAWAYSAAQKYGIDPQFFQAQIQTESGFNPQATGPMLSGGMGQPQGIAQFIPGTAAQYGLSNPYDPQSSLDAAARYDADLLGKYGSYQGVLAHYGTVPQSAQTSGNLTADQSNVLGIASSLDTTGTSGQPFYVPGTDQALPYSNIVSAGFLSPTLGNLTGAPLTDVGSGSSNPPSTLTMGSPFFSPGTDTAIPGGFSGDDIGSLLGGSGSGGGSGSIGSFLAPGTDTTVPGGFAGGDIGSIIGGGGGSSIYPWGSGITGILPDIFGGGGGSGSGAGAASQDWFQQAVNVIGDFFQRAGVVVLGLILIAAAVFAFTREHGYA